MTAFPFKDNPIIMSLIGAFGAIREEYRIICNHWEFLRKIYHQRFYTKILALSDRKNRFFRKNPVARYIRKCFSTLIEAGFLTALTGLLTFLLLYTARMLWHFYLHTPMGGKFTTLYPERAMALHEFADLDLFPFVCELTLISFMMCMGIGAVCRFLHIAPSLYHSQGFFGKLFFWGPPLTAAVAFCIQFLYDFSDWEISAYTSAIPTYILFISCFKYAEKLIPEIGEVIRTMMHYSSKWFLWIMEKIFPPQHIVTPDEPDN